MKGLIENNAKKIKEKLQAGKDEFLIVLILQN